MATFEGVLHVQGMLPAVGGHEFVAELDRWEHELYRADQEAGSLHTTAQRRADALVEMARTETTTMTARLRHRPRCLSWLDHLDPMRGRAGNLDRTRVRTGWTDEAITRRCGV